MPTVTLSKKRIFELLGKKLDDKTLADRTAMLGTDVEAITQDEITVEVFPNRPDMLSEEGLARALKSFLGIKAGLQKYDAKKSGFSVTNASPLPHWPYVVAAIVEGLDFDDEKIRQVMQLQEKLGVTLLRRRKKGAIGMYPLDKIKMPVKFASNSADKIRFRPLEYPEVISGREILQEHPTGREYAHILEGWKEFPYFADSEGKIMSMPPVINSHDVGKITSGTTDVFVEATGTDLKTLKVALNILVASLADMGGKVYSMQILQGKQKFETPDLSPRKMKLDIEYVSKLLGLSLKESELKNLLGKMGYGYEKGIVLIPAYRDDILHPFDLAEDVAIAHGYENFKPEIPKVATIGGESHEAVFRRKLSEVLSGLGFLECNTYHLSGENVLIGKMNAKKAPLIKTSNAVNIDYDALRNAILPLLMKVLSENKHYEYPQKIFEAGIVFVKDAKTETGIAERLHIAGVWAHNSANFSEIKGVLDAIFRQIDFEYSVKEAENPSYLSGRCAEIFVKGMSVGFVGEIHPQVLNNWEIEVPVAGFEIELGMML